MTYTNWALIVQVIFGLQTGVVVPDMMWSFPLSALRLTQTRPQLSVHMFLSVPDVTAPRGNPVNVTACPVRLLFCQAVTELFLMDEHTQ